MLDVVEPCTTTNVELLRAAAKRLELSVVELGPSRDLGLRLAGQGWVVLWEFVELICF